MKILAEEMGFDINNIAFVAFTGKASLVLQEKGLPAYTIHRLMYIPYEVVDPNDSDNIVIKFRKRTELPSNIQLIICDEASMVPEDMQLDLESFGVPVLYIGDHFQLPPVKGDCLIFGEADYRLTEIHRQALGNPIIQVSKMIREGKAVPYGIIGNSFLKIRLDKMDPKQFMLANQILCGKNITRRKYNALQRARRGFTSDMPMVGDKVINLKNDWDIGIVNGQIGKITKIHEINQPKDRILLDFLSDDGTPFRDCLCQLSIFTGIEQPKGRWDGVKTMQMDYAEAITVHKSQGSQWNNVLVLEEMLGFDTDAHRKWLYTAVTRAVSKLILVTNA
jgi:exodeoxyribonuclease-5